MTKPTIRVALVKYRPNGNEYSARCDREDIGVGADVEVLASSGESRFGKVVAIRYERWNCKDTIELLESEVDFELVTEGDDFYVKRVARPSRPHLRLVINNEVRLHSPSTPL